MKAKRSIRVAAAGALAFAGLMTAGVGVSNAATLQTEANYPNRAACITAGPGVKATTGGDWNNFCASRIASPLGRGAWFSSTEAGSVRHGSGHVTPSSSASCAAE